MQKEKLSALVDGEMLDSKLLSVLSTDKALQQNWQRYHLIRDVLRGDAAGVLHLDTSCRVAAALEKEPTPSISIAVSKSQPSTWQKIRPWVNQLTQVGIAACVALAVIVSVQYYSHPAESYSQPESPMFNTLPMIGAASPVSFGVPSNSSSINEQQQEQHSYKHFELQRHPMQSEQWPLKQPIPSQPTAQLSETQSSQEEQQQR